MLYAAFLTLLIASVSAQAPTAGISSASNSKCMEVRNFANIKDGNRVQMNDCDNSTSQTWEIFSGLTEIILADPDLSTRFCVDAIDVDAPNPAVVWGCNQNPQQQFIFTDDGLLTLANNTNLCLEVPGSSTANGVQLKTASCNGGLNQVWNLF